jgi:hypothetical protein
MRQVETIIVGGGPAGSTCARHLVMHGRDVLVLDKARFPRLKLCAGWITAKVMRDLDFTAPDYPHPILPLDIRTHVFRLPFGLRWFPTPGPDYSIRRVEFDAWLLARSGAEVVEHEVKSIRREGDKEGGKRAEMYVIDNAYSCRYLVGAGGTMCPVRRALFPDGRIKSRQIVTLEQEFEYPARPDVCHLYFFRRGLIGYAWMVPKGNGFVNVGLAARRRISANPAPRSKITSEPSSATWCARSGSMRRPRRPSARPAIPIFCSAEPVRSSTTIVFSSGIRRASPASISARASVPAWKAASWSHRKSSGSATIARMRSRRFPAAAWCEPCSTASIVDT